MEEPGLPGVSRNEDFVNHYIKKESFGKSQKDSFFMIDSEKEI
jgi:hypothetical protein